MSKSTINSFLAEQGYSEATEKQYSRILNDLLSSVHVENLTASEFKAWLKEHTSWGDSMKWLAYSATRAYIRWAYGSEHPALRLRIKRPPSEPQRTLSIEQAKKVFDHFDASPKGIRDRAIFSMLLDTGIRSAELCGLALKHLYLQDLLIAVRVKGNRWEYGVFSEITARHIEEWLSIRNSFAGSNETSIFVGIRGAKPGSPLTPGGLRAIIRAWGQQANIGPLSPHDFRRSFATFATIAKAPTRLTQIAGRWKNIREVERYTKALALKEFSPYSPVQLMLETRTERSNNNDSESIG